MENNQLPNLGLVILDIDGVLTDGESAPFDLELFQQLADLNRRARDKGIIAESRKVPPVTVCTGRPQAYVEAVLQALHCSLPGVFEGGAALFFPEGRRVVPHPMLGDRKSFREVRRVLEELVEENASFYLQPGKDFTASLFRRAPGNIAGIGPLEGLRELVMERIGSGAEGLELLYSASCLNILPKGIHKGTGVELLSEWTGVPLSAMLAVGDSEVDIPMFQKVGYRAAPSNATPEVKALADYVSPFKTTEGLRDILDRLGIS